MSFGSSRRPDLCSSATALIRDWLSLECLNPEELLLGAGAERVIWAILVLSGCFSKWGAGIGG